MQLFVKPQCLQLTPLVWEWLGWQGSRLPVLYKIGMWSVESLCSLRTPISRGLPLLQEKTSGYKPQHPKIHLPELNNKWTSQIQHELCKSNWNPMTPDSGLPRLLLTMHLQTAIGMEIQKSVVRLTHMVKSTWLILMFKSRVENLNTRQAQLQVKWGTCPHAVTIANTKEKMKASSFSALAIRIYRKHCLLLSSELTSYDAGCH